MIHHEVIMDPEDLNIYFHPTEAIESDNNEIREVAQRLTTGLRDPVQKSVALFYFVRDEIHYSVYMISTYFEDFRASVTLERRRGYCVQKAILLAALARAVGIPSRLAFAKIRNHRVPEHVVKQTGTNILPSHGYTQLYIHGTWISVTPAFDRSLCEKSGLPPAEFDGVHDALLSDTDLYGRPFIEYLEKYEPQPDFPFSWLRERLLPIWGERHAWLQDADSKGHVMPSGFAF
jgi:transglutaminase-like putative cysteine protease